MEDNKSDIKPEKEDETPSPTPAPEKESGNIPPTSETSAVAPKPVAEFPGKETSRAGQFFRTLLIWLGVILLAFLAGVLTYHFARYRPTATSLTKANQTVSELQTQNDDLSSQLKVANDKNSSLDSKNRSLQDDLDAANTHIELLQALAEINAAHIALANQDVAGAKVALADPPNRLEILKPAISSVDAALAENILQRLELINSSMGTDSESAQADLGLLAKNLLNVETLLFNK